MKEKQNQEYINNGSVKKIFTVLHKKHKRENSPTESYKNKKKKMFVLQKITPNISKNTFNENIINNINIINYNQTNNIENNKLIIFQKNTEENINNKNTIVKENIFNITNIKTNSLKEIQNNINNNNNIISNNPNINTNKFQGQTQTKEIGDYICYIQNQIGAGSFGQVLYGKHKRSSLEVAVKIINSDTSEETIQKEIKYSKKLQEIPGFPIIYYHCVHEKKNIIIESLLGPSLDKLFKYCNRCFPLKTVCLIGKQIVTRLENMHEKGIIHRDLKPNNLTWGNFNSSYNNISSSNNLDINTIYLIDFGLSCSYLEGMLGLTHYKKKTNLNFIGTLRYASLNSHKGIRQSRRDDLESMMYILIYFLKGKLPWQDIKAKNKEERYKIIHEKKSSVSVESLCEGIPNEFAELLKYVKNMEFEEKPYYCKFYSYFHNLIERISKEKNEEKNYDYIWETLLVDNMNKYYQENDRNIKDFIENYIFKGYPINLKNFTNYVIYSSKTKK